MGYVYLRLGWGWERDVRGAGILQIRFLSVGLGSERW